MTVPTAHAIAHRTALDDVKHNRQVSVTAIGSCRVVGPLRRAGKEDGFKLNQTGVYGYCHSSAEAVQQLRVLNGALTLPEYLLPVIAPRTAESPNGHKPHKRSDFYFVELSSAKILSVDGICVQLNYFTRHFETFFSDRNRARAFWRAVREGDDTQRKEVLDHGAQRLPADQYMLENLKMEMSTPEGLRDDIDLLMSIAPRVLFVTHFNAKKHDGGYLAARESYLAMLRGALRASNARYFDPSDYVEAYGQSEALKDPDGSLSHYSDAFEDYLYQNWLSRYIRPLVQLHAEHAELQFNQNDAAAPRAAIG